MVPQDSFLGLELHKDPPMEFISITGANISIPIQKHFSLIKLQTEI